MIQCVLPSCRGTPPCPQVSYRIQNRSQFFHQSSFQHHRLLGAHTPDKQNENHSAFISSYIAMLVCLRRTDINWFLMFNRAALQFVSVGKQTQLFSVLERGNAPQPPRLQTLLKQSSCFFTTRNSM